MPTPANAKRIELLDGVRGFAIIAMVVYHGMYDITDIFGASLPVFSFFTLLEPWFAGMFILLCGVSSRFSRSNFKRGVRVLALGLVLTAATVLFMPSQSIYFGILHFLGAAILLFALLRPALDRLPLLFLCCVCLALFAVTYRMPETYQLGVPGFSVLLPSAVLEFAQSRPWLFPLGLPDMNFYSADYFPLIPWFFLFLVGTAAGVPIRQRKLPEWFYTVRAPFFASAGRHTLIIYLLHQPILYGLLWLLFRVF